MFSDWSRLTDFNTVRQPFMPRVRVISAIRGFAAAAAFRRPSSSFQLLLLDGSNVFDAFEEEEAAVAAFVVDGAAAKLNSKISSHLLNANRNSPGVCAFDFRSLFILNFDSNIDLYVIDFREKKLNLRKFEEIKLAKIVKT